MEMNVLSATQDRFARHGVARIGRDVVFGIEKDGELFEIGKVIGRSGGSDLKTNLEIGSHGDKIHYVAVEVVCWLVLYNT